MKKIITSLLLLLITVTFMGTINAESGLTPLPKANGSGYVTYRNSTTQVMIPTEYTARTTEFRGVWVSPLVNDINRFTSKEQYMRELNLVLDTMEFYKLNTIVFHVRILNDALYDSDLNPQSTYTNMVDYDEWDHLEWLIGEVHRRGMEFHAWLNPYRIDNRATTMNAVKAKYINFPNNPANKDENVILGSSGAILNPGEPAVREFVIDTVMEVIEKYNVDAIHFDDYFYASMPYDADLATYNKYKANSSTNDIHDWRREQVDLFIQNLSQTIRDYNSSNGRFVQLGISPTGIWRNGNGQVTYDSNGTAITSGSNTAGQEHYALYLYANSKKWVDEEWIDYITPQSYWSFELPAAPYADVVDWWAKVVKNKNVNLYTGMGLYRRFSGDSGGSWETNPMEAANQVLYNSKHSDIRGSIIFNYRYLNTAKTVSGVQTILNDYWTNPIITPEIRTMSPVVPGNVNNVVITKKNNLVALTWDSAVSAARYAIYRSEGEIDINNPKQIISLVGTNSDGNNIANDTIDSNKKYNYAVVPISGTSTIGTPTVVSTDNSISDIGVSIGNMSNLQMSANIFPNANAQISFSSANIYVGDSPVYQLELSTDGNNWITVDSRDIKASGDLYLYNFKYNEIGAKIFARVTATNTFGSITSNTLTMNPTISNINEYFDMVNLVLNNQIKKIFE
ncbi:MAG: family 10 glycosylhydrolase [Bacilli bacterium]